MINKYFSITKKLIKNKFFLKPTNDLKETLKILAEHEIIRKTVPHRHGAIVESYLREEQKLQELGQVSHELLLIYPNSILLTYFKVVVLAKNEELEEANNIISKAIIHSRLNNNNYEEKLVKRRTIAFLKIWRVLDLIARGNMKWADGNNILRSNYDNLEFLDGIYTEENRTLDFQLSLFYAETSLQGKNIEKYIADCMLAYDQCNTLSERLKVIFAIRREGIRKLPSYEKVYDLSKKLFHSNREDIKEYLASEKNLKILQLY